MLSVAINSQLARGCADVPLFFSENLQQIGNNCSLLSIRASPSWQLFNSLHLSGLKIIILIKNNLLQMGIPNPHMMFWMPGAKSRKWEGAIVFRLRVENWTYKFEICMQFLRPILYMLTFSRTKVLSSIYLNNWPEKEKTLSLFSLVSFVLAQIVKSNDFVVKIEPRKGTLAN